MDKKREEKLVESIETLRLLLKSFIKDFNGITVSAIVSSRTRVIHFYEELNDGPDWLTIIKSLMENKPEFKKALIAYVKGLKNEPNGETETSEESKEHVIKIGRNDASIDDEMANKLIEEYVMNRNKMKMRKRKR